MDFSLDRFYQINRKAIIWIILFALIFLLRKFFTLIFLTYIIGFFALPASNFLMRKLRLSRTLAIVMVYSFIFVAYIGLYVMIIPSVFNQVAGLQAKLPEIQKKLHQVRDDLVSKYPNAAGMIGFHAEPSLFHQGDIDWPRFYVQLVEDAKLPSPSPGRRVMDHLAPETRQSVQDAAKKSATPLDYSSNPELENEILKELNEKVLANRDFYRSWDFGEIAVTESPKIKALLARNRQALAEQEVQKLNRLLLEAAYPKFIVKSQAAEDELEAMIDEARVYLQTNIPQFTLYAVGFFMTSLLAILFSFLISYDYARLTREVESLSKSRLRDFFEEAAQPVVKFALSIGKGFQAMAFIAFVTTLLMLIPLFALRVSSVALLALLTFVTSLIPVVGAIPQFAAIGLVTLNEKGLNSALWMMGSILIIHGMIGYVIGPYIFGREFRINPVAVVFILFVGHQVGGVWGMMLGVPAATYLLRDVFAVPIVEDKDGAPSI